MYIIYGEVKMIMWGTHKMMERWNGKIAIVTGASAGIGAAITVRLVQCGLHVIGLARRECRLAKLRQKLDGSRGKFYSLKVDITKENEIIDAFNWITENVGVVHILVNNAGVIRPNGLLDGETRHWRQILDTNILAVCISTREAVRIMRVNNVDGHVIHINSILGHYVANVKLWNIYAATKYAVTGLTETLRQELNSIGSKIKITSVSPGFTNTEIVQASGTRPVMDKCLSLEPEDVAEAVVYVLGTPNHVQVHEVMLRAVGQPF